jgi:xanthine dehydrogenase molybdopterin-binding subunit B
MDREDNMRFSPGRHPIMAEYKVGFAKTGKIKALDVKVFVDGGYCTELSPVALELILLQIDAAYFVPNFKAWGTVCRTNYQTPTVMRATGRTQQVIITETIIDHIASACGLPRHVVQVS